MFPAAALAIPVDAAAGRPCGRRGPAHGLHERSEILGHVHQTADDAGRDGPAGVSAECDRLLGAVAGGDQAAFGDLYDLLAPRVLGAIRRLVIDPEQSEEVAQDVFLQVWQDAPGFDPARGSAAGWILTIARRRAVDRIRAAQAAADRDLRVGIRDLRPVADTADTAQTHLERQRAGRAMRELSDVQRQAIVLAYDHGYTHSEIAALLGVPVGTVKTRLRDGMMRLRHAMEVTR